MILFEWAVSCARIIAKWNTGPSSSFFFGSVAPPWRLFFQQFFSTQLSGYFWGVITIRSLWRCLNSTALAIFSQGNAAKRPIFYDKFQMAEYLHHPERYGGYLSISVLHCQGFFALPYAYQGKVNRNLLTICWQKKLKFRHPFCLGPESCH